MAKTDLISLVTVPANGWPFWPMWHSPANDIVNMLHLWWKI